MKKWRIVPALALVFGTYFTMPAINADGQPRYAQFPLYRVGSSGGGVTEIQSRLARIGYYSGAPTGFFWWKTYWAVRDFQYAFGLPTDGIVGAQTMDALRRATPAWRRASLSAASPATPQPAAMASDYGSFSAHDINLMAHVVYGEARNQPFEGEVGVAAVILNRYHSNLFPHSIPAIIFQPGAFTSISNGQAWQGMNASCQNAVLDAIHGWDPTHGALYYWNPATAVSTWVWNQPILLRIGNHVFAK